MKKALVIGLTSVILGTGCLAQETPIAQPPLQNSPLTLLESFVHRDYIDGEDRARRNNEYLIESIKNRTDIQSLIKNPKALKRSISDKLANINYNHYRDYPNYGICEGVYCVEQLTPRQLLRIYLFLEAFEQEGVRNKVGALIEEDTKDKSAEHGGIVLYNDRITFLPFASVFLSSQKASSSLINLTALSDAKYLIPDEALDIPNLARFHFHARTEDHSKYAGPSISIDNFGYLKESDICSAHHEICFEGESHDLVMTKLKGKMFNVAYFGGEWQEHRYINITILDLGDYSYE